MDFIQSIKKNKLFGLNNKIRAVNVIYSFFVVCFIFYAIGDLLTSSQTYHWHPDRKLSYISLAFLVLSIILGIVFFAAKAIRNKEFKIVWKRFNPFLFISLVLVVIIEIISSLINKTSFSTLFHVAIYPIIFTMIYTFFIELDYYGLDKKLIFLSFLLFFVVYFLFFIFYFFYIQGKPTSGGGLRIPTLAHVFFLLPIFCFLRRFLQDKTIIILYCFFVPTVFLSGKMSVTLILLFYLLSDLINSSFFIKNKKWMLLLLLSIAVIIVFVFVFSNATKDNFLADNFSFYSLAYSGRIENWVNILPNMRNFTFLEWLFGKGPSATLQYNNGTAAHNDLIEFIFDYGLVGAIIFIGLIVSLFLQFKIKKDLDKREMRLTIAYLLTINLFSAFFINMNMLYMVLPSLELQKKVKQVKVYENGSFFEVAI